MDDDSLVIVEHCYDMTHAHILRGFLESNGIPSFLLGENHHNVQPHLSIALGGIRVLVRESDFQKARELIGSMEELPVQKTKAFLQKPYWKSIILGIAGLFVGAPAMRAQGKHEE